MALAVVCLNHLTDSAVCAQMQRIKDWAVKMRNPEVPYNTIEECARTADIIGVSVFLLLLPLLCFRASHGVYLCHVQVQMLGCCQLS